MRINSVLGLGFTLKNNQNNHINKNGYLKNTGCDKVSFGATRITNVLQPVNVDIETAKVVANSLSTSTSGHRAPYMSKTFNPDVVRLITLGVAGYAKDNAKDKTKNPVVLIGGDTRRATRESLPLIRDTLIRQGINVLDLKDPVPTPVLAIEAQNCGTDAAVLMTASHNPWTDGGYNLVTSEGAVAPATVTKQIARHMIDIAKDGKYSEQIVPKGQVIGCNPYYSYRDKILRSGLIDFEKIKNSGLEIFYDGLQGTGVYVMPRLFNEFGIPIKEIKSSGQEGPNPTDANLGLLKETISRATKIQDAKLRIGLANDGDADRFGVVDENGKFISPNDVILLVGYHLAKNKGRMGDIIRSQATSMKLDKLAENYGVDVNITPVGFKYIGEDILEKRKFGKDILVAGEESGGLTVNGHIPEKDGIIAISLIADLIATEGRPLSEILEEAKNSLGISICTNNISKKFTDDSIKNKIMDRVADFWTHTTSSGENNFDDSHKVDIEATLEADRNMRKYKPSGDGFKFVLTDGSTVLIRKSGTEPLIRCYIEATGKNDDTAEENSAILNETVSKLFKV